MPRRDSTLLVACTLVSLSLAFVPPSNADVPSLRNSSVPACIAVTGHDASGVSDPIGEFTVVERDLANQPVRNGLIVVDFSGVTELRLCTDDHDPNEIVDCGTRTVRRFTDANGVARFRVTGWSVATPGTPGTSWNGGKIFADGVLLGSPSASIYDLDKSGLSAGDLSAWLADFFSGNNAARDDYDCSGGLGANDLATWLSAYFANGSLANCSPAEACP